MKTLLDTTADWLPNLRYRSYFYTDGGTLKIDGLVQPVVEAFPSLQVRLRTVIQAYRRGGAMAGLHKLISSPAALIEYHHQQCTTRDVLAALSNTKVQPENNRFIDIVEGAEPIAHREKVANDTQHRYIIVGFGDIYLHPAAPTVLFQFASTRDYPAVIYSQHVKASGDCVVKPEFDSILYAAYDFIGPAVFLRQDVYDAYLAAHSPLTPQAIYQAIDAIVQAGQQPQRVDEFLVKSDRSPTDLSDIPTRFESMETATTNKNIVRQWQYECHTQPLVSVIIPTFNGLSVLRPCIESLIAMTEYQNKEIIVVDNNSDDPETLDYLALIARRGVNVIRYPHPFNYSAINNFAVSHAKGEYLCLLNNDVEVLEPAWLLRMVCWAMLPHVGAVGAKLLYGNGRIQHAGVVVGMGNAAGHLHRLEQQELPHHQYRISLNQTMTAVTAACLVVNRDKFNQAGGLNETNLAVAYNDIDLCMKLNSVGYHTVYCADATLYHHESVSRGDDLSSDKVKRYMKELRHFQARWRVRKFVDRVTSRHWDRHLERTPQLKAQPEAFTLTAKRQQTIGK